MKKIGNVLEGLFTGILTILVILGTIMMVLFGTYSIGYAHGREGREYILSQSQTAEEEPEELPSVLAFLGE